MKFIKEVRNSVEFRIDPLTGEQARINPERARRVKQAELISENRPDFIDKSRHQCPFCPENVGEKTPIFPEDICKEGRINIGECILFPNLNPFGENHAVGILAARHYLDVHEFQEEMISNSIIASKKYIESVHRIHNEARYPIYLWNHMPPSAGSIIHPHIQLLLETELIPGQEKILKKSLEYYNKNTRNYWQHLVEEEEKIGERFIAKNKSLAIIASFAPRGFRDVQIIFHRVSSLADLNDEEIAEFARCVVNILKAYKEMGVGSFNLLTYSAAIDELLPYYRLNVRIISRPYPKGVYVNDTGPFERLYDSWVIDTVPEEIAKRIRKFFV